jgi:hypothetical protein
MLPVRIFNAAGLSGFQVKSVAMTTTSPPSEFTGVILREGSKRFSDYRPNRCGKHSAVRGGLWRFLSHLTEWARRVKMRAQSAAFGAELP